MLGEYESHRAFPSDGLFRFGSPCGRQCSVLQINSWRHMPVPWACRDHVEQQPVVWPSFRQRGYLHVNLQARGRRRNRNEPGISGSHTPICTVYRCGEAPRIEKKKNASDGSKVLSSCFHRRSSSRFWSQGITHVGSRTRCSSCTLSALQQSLLSFDIECAAWIE